MKTHFNKGLLVLAALVATVAHANNRNLCYLTNSEPDYGVESPTCAITISSDINKEITEYDYSCLRNVDPVGYAEAKNAAASCSKGMTWDQDVVWFDSSVLVTIDGKTQLCSDAEEDFEWLEPNGLVMTFLRGSQGDTLQAHPAEFPGTVSTSLAQKNTDLAKARAKAEELKASGYCDDVVDNTDFSNEVDLSKQ